MLLIAGTKLGHCIATTNIPLDEVGDITSEEELTSSEALTTTMSEDNSLPTSLQQHLHALQVEQLNSYSELSVDVVPQQEGEQVPSTKVEAQLDLNTDEGELGSPLSEQKEVTVDPASHQSTVDTVAPCEELEVEISEPQVNVDVPQMEEVTRTSSPSPKQTDLPQEEGNVELDHVAEDQAVTIADVEKDQPEVVEPEEAMPTEPKEVEPSSVEPKAVEAEVTELEEAEVQAVEPKEAEQQSEEPKEIEQQPAEPIEVEKPSAELKEAEQQPEESTEPKEIEPPPAEVATEEQNVDLPLETKQPGETDAPAASQEPTQQQNVQAEIILPEESKVLDEDNVLKVSSEEAEQKQAEPANTCEETPVTKDSTTCIMTFISDTADDQNLQQGKVFSDDEQQKEDPGTPDEAEASPVPLLKEIAAGTPKLSPDDAQGANAEAEDSSEATETGADISELKSFAEESHGHEKQLVAEEIPAPIPEEEYCPSIRMGLIDEAPSEDSAVLCKGQGTQTSLALSLTPPQAVSKEHSTQTDEEQGVAVLGVQTSFLHDEGGVETRAGSHGPVKTEGVTEILLDALLPSETQLLIKDTQVVGSKPSQNVEIDASEAEGVPCIVTSHVSLAFLGLDSQKPESLTAISVDGKKTENLTTVTAKPGAGTAQTPISQESKTECEHKPELLLDKNKVTEVQAACEKNIPEDTKHTEENNQIGKESDFVDRSHTAPKTSDQISKDDKNALQELEAKEIQKEAGNEPLPDSPSLEAIAEAVAAATTRAALDLLATTNSDTLIKPQEVQEAAGSSSISSLPKTADTKVVPSEPEEEARKPSEQVTEASRSQTQSDASQPSTVYIATVTHTPSPSPTSTPEKEKTQESVEADLMKASLPQGEIPAETVKTSQTDAASPLPISQDVVVTKTVEAALAEAAEEVCDISTNKDAKHQDTTATQDRQGVATVSPNEDSPTSSKGSSPDMEEYEVINKDEDTAHKLRTQRETSGGEPVNDKVKAAESTEVSSQAAQLHTDEEGASKKETEHQKEEKVVKGKERSSSKEPEEKKSSDKTNVHEDQGKDSTTCPVDDSSTKASDPQATPCMPSESHVAEEGQTDIDSSTLKESDSSDNADSE
ncbi:titin-like [Penaeus monodon]|uniref:titin-like n=1 Tax=Penaeus monodon TaxID=6687 RepID=UPI0018A7BC4E|nr:titin-like [Penaeus monodon]